MTVFVTRECDIRSQSLYCYRVSVSRTTSSFKSMVAKKPKEFTQVDWFLFRRNGLNAERVVTKQGTLAEPS